MQISQHLEQATQTLARPQPLVSDLLGEPDLSDQCWSIKKMPCYEAQFPGIEALCGPLNTKDLEAFLASCILSRY